MTPVRSVRNVRLPGFQRFQACFLHFLPFLQGSNILRDASRTAMSAAIWMPLPNVRYWG